MYATLDALHVYETLRRFLPHWKRFPLIDTIALRGRRKQIEQTEQIEGCLRAVRTSCADGKRTSIRKTRSQCHEMTEETTKRVERTRKREKERDSIQSAEALTQRGKSPKRKPLTTSTGWKKNRLRELRGGRFFPSLSFSYSIFPPYFLSLPSPGAFCLCECILLSPIAARFHDMPFPLQDW